MQLHFANGEDELEGLLELVDQREAHFEKKIRDNADDNYFQVQHYQECLAKLKQMRKKLNAVEDSTLNSLVVLDDDDLYLLYC